jgi:hypothetical protein
MIFTDLFLHKIIFMIIALYRCFIKLDPYHVLIECLNQLKAHLNIPIIKLGKIIKKADVLTFSSQCNLMASHMALLVDAV